MSQPHKKFHNSFLAVDGCTFRCDSFHACQRTRFVCSNAASCHLECECPIDSSFHFPLLAPLSCMHAELQCAGPLSFCTANCTTKACLGFVSAPQQECTRSLFKYSSHRSGFTSLRCTGDWACFLMGDYQFNSECDPARNCSIIHDPASLATTCTCPPYIHPFYFIVAASLPENESLRSRLRAIGVLNVLERPVSNFAFRLFGL